MKEILTLYSCIHPQLMRRTLIKGLAIALLGITLLLYAGIAMPVTILKSWGPPLFLVGIGLITWGLLPYRKLTLLEKKPDQIHLMGMDYMEFYSRGQKKLSVPLSEIIKTDYIFHPKNYGIAIWLKSNPNPNSSPDLFFQYFSERSYKELQEWIQSS